MTRIPGPHLCPSGIMWLWKSDGTGPAVFRYNSVNAQWEGYALRLSVGVLLNAGWHWCEGSSITAQPSDPACLINLNQVSWDGYPEWFIKMYAGV